MIKIAKLITVLFIVLNLMNSVLAQDTFFDEGKKNIMKRNIKNQNFYFKEVLYLILKIRSRTYT